MAGISSMATVMTMSEKRATKRTSQRKRCATCRLDKYSRVPVYEIPIQLQTRRCTFFWVELCCKNIISRHGSGKRLTIDSFAYSVRRFAGLGIVTMHEIEVSLLINAIPERMGQFLMHPVPAHLRYFEA